MPLFTDCLEEVFSETKFPVSGVLEHSMSIEKEGRDPV